MSDYWFRQRRVGRGWGLPCSAPGWVFFIAWLAALTVCALTLMPQRPLAFTGAISLLALILVGVCYAKGEPMSNRRSS
jgi:hypothetical protein